MCRFYLTHNHIPTICFFVFYPTLLALPELLRYIILRISASIINCTHTEFVSEFIIPPIFHFFNFQFNNLRTIYIKLELKQSLHTLRVILNLLRAVSHFCKNSFRLELGKIADFWMWLVKDFACVPDIYHFRVAFNFVD